MLPAEGGGVRPQPGRPCGARRRGWHRPRGCRAGTVPSRPAEDGATASEGGAAGRARGVALQRTSASTSCALGMSPTCESSAGPVLAVSGPACPSPAPRPRSGGRRGLHWQKPLRAGGGGRGGSCGRVRGPWLVRGKRTASQCQVTAARGPGCDVGGSSPLSQKCFQHVLGKRHEEPAVPSVFFLRSASISETGRGSSPGLQRKAVCVLVKNKF